MTNINWRSVLFLFPSSDSQLMFWGLNSLRWCLRKISFLKWNWNSCDKIKRKVRAHGHPQNLKSFGDANRTSFPRFVAKYYTAPRFLVQKDVGRGLFSIPNTGGRMQVENLLALSPAKDKYSEFVQSTRTSFAVWPLAQKVAGTVACMASGSLEKALWLPGGKNYKTAKQEAERNTASNGDSFLVFSFTVECRGLAPSTKASASLMFTFFRVVTACGLRRRGREKVPRAMGMAKMHRTTPKTGEASGLKDFVGRCDTKQRHYCLRCFMFGVMCYHWLWFRKAFAVIQSGHLTRF